MCVIEFFLTSWFAVLIGLRYFCPRFFTLQRGGAHVCGSVWQRRTSPLTHATNARYGADYDYAYDHQKVDYIINVDQATIVDHTQHTS